MSSLDPLRVPLAGRQLIEASAGTGKTWTITALVVRLLLGHADGRTGVAPRRIDEILVVTFTNAATEELRGRVRERLAEAQRVFASAEAASDDEFLLRLRAESSDRALDARRLAQAAMDLDLAAIFTIHGFAARMLDRHAFESGAAFGTALAADDGLVVEETIRDIWRERVYPLRGLPGTLLATELKIEGYVGNVKTLLGKPGLQLLGVPADDWDTLCARLASGEAELREMWTQQGASLRAALAEVRINKGGATALAHAVDVLERGAPLDRLALDGVCASFLGSELRKAKNNALPAHPLLALGERLCALADALPLRLVADGVRVAAERLAELKARTGQLGFADLLRLLDEALCSEERGPRLAAAIRQVFPAALIDECQDTDPLQWRVFGSIYTGEDTTLVFVGDPKQAIYAFRGADVYAYLAERRRATQRHTLAQNQRSVAPLVGALNALFTLRADNDPFMAGGDIPYVEVEPSHRPDRNPLRRDGEVVAPVQLLPRPGGEAPGTGAYRTHMARVASSHIAHWLHEARANRITLGDRKLEPRDIACLVRTWQEAGLLARELERRGVPCVTRNRDSVFTSPAAHDLYQLLAAVLAPGSERKLRAALACALLGFDAAQLAAQLGDEQAFAAQQARFVVHRERLAKRGVQAMFRALLFEYEVPARLLSQRGGERALTDCLHLVELLAAEREQLDSDEALLVRLAESIAVPDGDSEQQQLRLASDADRVQIVTLHSAKGLEYPVVYLPFPAWVPKKENGVFHDPDSLRACFDLSAGAESKERHGRERLAEDMRLLYVGLTRAKHCCVLGACDIRHGNSKGSRLSLSAFGRLLDAAEDDPAAALARLARIEGVAQIAAAALDAPLPAPAPPAQEPLEPARFTAEVERDWRGTSFSAMVRDLGERAEQVFRQPELAAAARARPARRENDWSLFGFDSGAAHGSFLHAILEKVDFRDAGDSPRHAALVAAALGRERRNERWQPALCAMIDDVRGCALDAHGLRLADIAPAARVAELRFELPLVARVDAARLESLLRAHAPLGSPPAPSLEFDTVRGMLSGAIDLVFEHAGRYHLVDFKSNHLGDRLQDYVPDALSREIAAHRYDLQYLLYTVALVRHLRARLGGEFDYERQFGGAWYLFLRGMHAAAGPAHGVFHARPPRALIEALDAMFAGSAA